MKTLALHTLSIIALLGSTTAAMAGHGVLVTDCSGAEVNISFRNPSNKAAYYQIRVSGKIQGGTDLSIEEFNALKNVPNPSFESGQTLFNGKGYDSVNSYAGTLSITGTLLDVQAIDTDYTLTSTSGERPVRGPDSLRQHAENCVVTYRHP